MESTEIWGIPVLNFQALLGVICFLAAIFTAKIVNKILAGKLPGGAGSLIYLRMVLGFLLAGAACFFFGALLGKQFI